MVYESAFFVQFSILESADIRRLSDADRNQDPIEYAGIVLDPCCEGDFVPSQLELKDPLLRAMLAGQDLSPPFKGRLLDDWALMVLTFWPALVRRVVVRRLSFHWCKEVHLARLCIEGTREGPQDIISTDEPVRLPRAKRAAEDDEIDWTAGEKSTKQRAKPKAKSKSAGAKHTMKKGDWEAGPVYHELFTDSTDQQLDADPDADAEDKMLAQLLDKAFGNGHGKQILENLRDATLGEEAEDDPIKGQPVANMPPPPEPSGAGTRPARASPYDIVRIASSANTFKFNTDAVKSRIRHDSASGRYFLDDVSGGGGAPKQLLTIRWVGGTDTVKLHCDLHRGHCKFMATLTDCYDQIDEEVLELAALAASYDPDITDGGLQHHSESAKAATQRLQELGRFTRDVLASDAGSEAETQATATQLPKTNTRKRKTDAEKMEAELRKKEKAIEKLERQSKKDDKEFERAIKKAHREARSAMTKK